MQIITLLLYLGAILICLIAIFLIFWKFWFLRDPKRDIPKGSHILSPADGKINKIISSDKKIESIDKGLLGRINTCAEEISRQYHLISIVMTPLDVHIQRSPIQGKVTKIRYSRGRFRNAIQKGIAIENERNEIIIQGSITVKVIQIAGFLARRIECFVEENQKVDKGQRIGLINLGSQVSLIIPKDVDLAVKEGQRVTAGETIIATLKPRRS